MKILILLYTNFSDIKKHAHININITSGATCIIQLFWYIYVHSFCIDIEEWIPKGEVGTEAEVGAGVIAEAIVGVEVLVGVTAAI